MILQMNGKHGADYDMDDNSYTDEDDDAVTEIFLNY